MPRDNCPWVDENEPQYKMPRDNCPWVDENETQEETEARSSQENQSTSPAPVPSRSSQEIQSTSPVRGPRIHSPLLTFNAMAHDDQYKVQQIPCSSTNQELQTFDSLDNQMLSQRIARKSDKMNKSQKVEKKTSCGRVIREPVRLEQERVEGIPKYTERQRARKLRQKLNKSNELTTENLLKRMDNNNIFNTVGDGFGEVNINHYYEIDSEEVENGIKKDPAEYLKVDIKAEAHDVDDSIKGNDLENYHFVVEKDKKPKKGNVRFKSLQCPHCEKAYSSTPAYNKHLRDVHGEDVYVPEKRIMKKCPSCEQEFNVNKSSYKLVVHLRLVHHDEDLSAVIEELELGDEGRVVCQICGETKRNKNILASHIKTIHEESELVPCHICGKLLRQNYASMYNHLRNHTTVDTPCKYCGQIFKNRRAARKHQKSHEPDFKKIECKVCFKKFSTMNHLKNHSRYVHLKLKDAKCDICGKLFSTNSKMTIHRNSVHSQEKQFACEFCPYRSARKDNLQTHRRKTHGVDNYKMVAHTPQIPEIPFYLKNANSERSENPQVREEQPTHLNDANSNKSENPRHESAHLMMREIPTFLNDANSDKSENPHHENAHLMMSEVHRYDQNSTQIETPHHMVEMLSYMKDQSSDKSKICQIPATMREMPTYLKYHMGDLTTYSQNPSPDKSEIRQMPGNTRVLSIYFKDQNSNKNVATHSPEIGSAHLPEMELPAYLKDQDMKNYLKDQNVVAHTPHVREFFGYMKDHSYDAMMEEMRKTQQMPATMEEMRKIQQMPAMMEEMRKTQQMSAMMEEMRKTQQMPATMEEMRKTQQMPAMMEEMRTQQMPAMMEEMRRTQQMPAMMEEMRKTQQMPAMMEEMRNILKNHYQ